MTKAKGLFWLMFAASLLFLEVSESRAGVVHVIVASDTSAEADLGGDVVADKSAVEAMFKENVPPAQLNMQTMLGRDLSPESVLQKVNSLRVEKRKDAIVFYYTGHGAHDSERGHFFALPNRKHLLRSQLEEAIVAKEPRTGVTITDCCAAGARYRAKDVATLQVKAASELSPLFRYLLFDRCGFISITSSEPGEVSLTRGDGKGSLFTYPFTDYMRKNANRQLTWGQVLENVSERVQSDFTSVTKGKGVDTDRDGQPDQWTQTVHPFVLTPALGMWVEEQPGGLRITGIVPLSPAYHAGLEVGDALLEVNGETVRTERQYDVAVDQSSRIMKMKIRDHRRFGLHEITVKLNQ